jgi:arabinose-5-phosphate isomerase
MLNTTEDIIDNAANILIEEAMGLSNAAQRLKDNAESREGYQQAIYLMFKSLDAGGKVVVTGVGKSGKIGEKIVATMLSTGTCATFLHPVEALHGDLGTVQPNDIVLALSFSGNTEELLMLLPSLKHRNIPVIGLGGNSKSKLAKESAAWIDAYVKCEAGGSIPAPTSSTTLTLALGDALALTLAKLRFFTTDGFALNHPGGSLGRRLLLKVKDIVIDTAKVACVGPKTSLDIVIMEMTRHPRGSGVIVLEDDSNDMHIEEDNHIGNANFSFPSPPLSETSSLNEFECSKPSKIAGVITHGDIHRILQSSTREGIFQICAADIMSLNPIVFNEEGLASDAIATMKEKCIPLLPVINNDKNWVGVITLKDLQELF